MRLRPAARQALVLIAPSLLGLAASPGLAAAGVGARVGASVTIAPAAPAWRSAAQGETPLLPGLSLTDEPGDPRVPFRDVYLLLPPDANAGDITVQPDQVRTESVPGPVAVAGPLLTSEGAAVTWDRLRADGLSYPDRWGELLGQFDWHGRRIAAVRLYPLRLGRAASSGAWTEAQVAGSLRVDLALTGGVAGVRRERPAPGEAAEISGRLSALVANPEMLARYPVDGAAAAPRQAGFAPTWAPSVLGSSVDCVIVTSAALAGEFQRLADYRTARGLPTVVRTIEDIVIAYPVGADTPEKIRSFIKDAYVRWGTRYALLGGDISVVPTRMVFNTFYPAGSGTQLPVDLYYGGLDGNWNADGDSQLGEPYVNTYSPGDAADLTAEVYVGRAPVTTVADAAIFINKIIDYERDGVGAQYGRMLFLSEVLFPSDYTPGTPIAEDGASYSQAIIDEVIAGAPAPLTPVRLYEDSPLWPGSYPESYAAAVDSLQSGRYGLVNHVGHGFFYNLSVGDRTLELKDASGLRNDPRYFILYSMGCASAAFDYNSILERFVINPNGGAVATLGSSRASFPVTAGPYQKEFYRELLVDGAYALGAAFADSRLPFDALTSTNTPERWTHMTSVLIGDPALTVWTTTPRSLEIALSDSLPLGEQSVPVTVTSGGAPLAGATVCLLKTDEDYSRATTDAAGQAALPLTIKSGGSVELSVTAPNCQPLSRTVPVASSARPYVKVADVAFVDDGTLGSHGNGDGVPDAGETLALVCTFRNSGEGASTGPTTVQLTAGDAYVGVQTGTAALPALAPGATATGSVPFLVTVAESAPDAAPFKLEVQAADGPRLYRDEIAGELHAPDLRISILDWTDAGTGDNDGVLEANENITVRFSLLNLGSGAASQLTGTVDTGNPAFIVVDGQGAWPDVAPLAEVAQSNPFVVRVTTLSNQTRGTLHLQDGFGHAWTHQFNLLAPAQPVLSNISSPAGGEILLGWNRSTDADLYGYHVYRSTNANDGFVRVTPLPITGGSFFRDTGLAPLTQYFYQIAAVDSARLLSRVSLTGVGSTIPSEKLGFPIELPVETSGHCAVGDVNGDGRMEAVLGADYLYAWGPDGVELRDGDHDSQTLGPFNDLKGIWGPAGVTLGDLTSRPGLEIVASYRTANQIYVYQGDGSVAPGWPRTMSAWNWATPAVGDIDGDGKLEVVVNNIAGKLYVWRADGTEFRDGDNDPSTQGVFQTRTNETYSFCSPALADIDGDGHLEIIFGTRCYDTQNDVLHALRNDGSEPPGWPVVFPYYGDVLDSPAVGDLDGDGQLEVVVITENDQLHVIEPNGTERAPFPITFVSNNAAYGIPCPSPALADINGDGQLEIVAVSVSDTRNAAIHVLTLAGTDLSGWPRTVPGNSESSPVVGDINGDGQLEILFGIGGGDDNDPNALYAFRKNGGTVPGFPLLLTGPVRPAPFLTDLDGDGKVEIVYGGWDLQMHAWSLPAAYVPSLLPWPTFKGNPLRTGRYPQSWATAVSGWELRAAVVGSGVELAAIASGQAGVAGPWQVERSASELAPTVLTAGGAAGGAPSTAGSVTPEWVVLGTAMAAGSDRFVFTDTAAPAGTVCRYRMRDLASGGQITTGPVVIAPAGGRLWPNWPNPFNPATRIAFEVPGGPAQPVRLTLYDLRGRRVARLVDQPLPGGRYVIDWHGRRDDGAPAASGIYLYRLETHGGIEQRKLTLLR